MTLRAGISDCSIIDGDPESDVVELQRPCSIEETVLWLVLTDPNHPEVKWNYSLTVLTVNYRSYLEEGKGSFSS